MKRLKNNWQWKLASVVIGFFLWSYITAGVNPTQTLNFRDVPLDLKNQQLLVQQDYVITEMKPRTVSVSIRGKRNALGNLAKESVKAVVDATSLKEGTQTLPITYELPNDLVFASKKTETTQVTVEKLISRSINVSVENTGELGNEYILEGFVSTPQTVEVTGPRSRINDVNRLVATVDISGLTKDQSSNVKILPVDREGREIEDLEMSLSSVNVTATILKKKEVPIKVETAGTPPDDIQITDVQCTPASILIKGKADIIDNLTEIKTKSVGVSALEKDYSADILLIFPSGVEPLDEADTANVRIQTRKAESREFDIPYAQVKTQGLTDEEIAVLLAEAGDLKVSILAFSEDFDALDKEDIVISAEVDPKDSLRLLFTGEVPEGFTIEKITPQTLKLE